MAIHLGEPAVDRAVREIAAARRRLRERVKRIQDHVASFEPTGLMADKAFYDELSGDVWWSWMPRFW